MNSSIRTDRNELVTDRKRVVTGIRTMSTNYCRSRICITTFKLKSASFTYDCHILRQQGF